MSMTSYILLFMLIPLYYIIIVCVVNAPLLVVLEWGVSMATPREQPHGNPRHGGLGWVGDNLIWNGVGWSKKKNIFALDWGGNGLDFCPLAGLG